MPVRPPPLPFDRADAHLTADLRAAFVDADRDAPITPSSVRLCASLGELAGAVYDALAPTPDPSVRHAVCEAAAALALLTKVDDQVIDGRPFHGGRATPRAQLRAKTARHLGDTLHALVHAKARGDEPRERLAAFTGAKLHALATTRRRRDAHLALVARGWRTQVDAVAVFTAHPSEVEAATVARVTARVSSQWLAMVSAVGALPLDGPMTARGSHVRGMLLWGRWIQRADALADLARDLDDGLLSTVATHTLWHRAPAATDDALTRGDARALAHLVCAHHVDRALLPSPAALDRAAEALDGLGALPAHLRAVHGYLAARWHALAASYDVAEAPCSAR